MLLSQRPWQHIPLYCMWYSYLEPITLMCYSRCAARCKRRRNYCNYQKQIKCNLTAALLYHDIKQYRGSRWKVVHILYFIIVCKWVIPSKLPPPCTGYYWMFVWLSQKAGVVTFVLLVMVTKFLSKFRRADSKSAWRHIFKGNCNDNFYLCTYYMLNFKTQTYLSESNKNLNLEAVCHMSTREYDSRYWI
jgi:hypothetical protein